MPIVDFCRNAALLLAFLTLGAAACTVSLFAIALLFRLLFLLAAGSAPNN